MIAPLFTSWDYRMRFYGVGFLVQLLLTAVFVIPTVFMYDTWHLAPLKQELRTIRAAYKAHHALLKKLVNELQRTHDVTQQVFTVVSNDLLSVLSHHEEYKLTARNGDVSTKIDAVFANADQEELSLIFSWPLEKERFWISSYFGNRRGRMHYGLDLAAHAGTPIYASEDGKVVFVGDGGPYGNMVLMEHDEKYKTRYAHMQDMHVQVGDDIKKGDVIGTVGNTGHVMGKNGNHLHFEVLEFEKPVNPMDFLV